MPEAQIGFLFQTRSLKGNVVSEKNVSVKNRVFNQKSQISEIFPRCILDVEYRHLSRIMRKTDFCLCENKGADQLRSNCEADQRLCFRYTDSIISLLLKSEISSFWPSSVTVHAGLCQTWSELPKTGFLASRLISIITTLSQLNGPVRGEEWLN